MITPGTGRTYYVLKTRPGMVLLLCLIFLMALTLLGLSASSDTILQNRLASNLQEAEHAKQSALSALSWAEHWLLRMEGPASAACAAPCNGLKLHASGDLPPRPEFEDYSWWAEQGHEAGINPLNGERIAMLSADSFHPPVWIVEAVHSIPPADNGTQDLQVWYRVLARGSSRTVNGVSVIESTIVRSWPVIEGNESPDNHLTEPCPGAEPAAICGRFSWRELR